MLQRHVCGTACLSHCNCCWLRHTLAFYLPAGYYAVVIGKRSEAASAAIARAYPAERLLRLGGADLDAAAAAAAAQAEGGPAADPLQVSG